MASAYSPWWKRYILYKIPGLFKKCPGGNYHWFWDQVCYCCDVYLFCSGRHLIHTVIRANGTVRW